MKALITGDYGFVGTQMTQELKSRGWDVYGYDIVNEGDAIDYLRDVSEDEYFDLVVHAAYVVGGREHIDGVNLALATNVQLDGALFEWALRTRQPAVLYFSSSAAYPTEYQTQQFGAHRLHEDDIYLNDPGTPDANYGWAKLTGERIAAQYAGLGGRVHVVRPFSGYSGCQSLDYPFPSIVQRVAGGDYSVWGPKGQTRDWIHIEDVVNGSLEIYFNDVRDPVNLCTGVPTEFGELVKEIDWQLGPKNRESAWGGGYANDSIEYHPEKPTGVFYRVGDPSRMLNYYEPKIDLEEGIGRACLALSGGRDVKTSGIY